MDAPAPDTLVDLLADLQHDLGKYLRLPLAWLPADAGDDDVREAAREALLATRCAGGRAHAAADIWQAFLADVQDAIDALPSGALSPRARTEPSSAQSSARRT